MVSWKCFHPHELWIIFILCLRVVVAQDEECSQPALCNQIVLSHSVQITTHCMFENLRFRNMSEEILPVGIFRLCRRTVILDISNNRIRMIKAGAFLGLIALQELYLANNYIERIEPGTFHTLTNLEVFVLSGNRITTIPEYEFTSKKMRYLNINNNQLKRIPQTALLNLHTPQLIDVSLNDLEDLHPNTFINTRPGGKMVLNNNRLGHLSFVFNYTSLSSTAKSLQFSVLEASGNVITTLTNISLGEFYKLRLVSLDLSFNYIREVHVETFDMYNTLQSLYLSHNRIKVVNRDLFKLLVNLNSLDLSYNHLTHMIFDVSLPETITSLNYSNNVIQNFPEYHWTSKMKRRQMYLDISNNSISYLDANRFCRFMSKVNLGYNKWKCPELYMIVHTLTQRGVNVISGTDFHTDNIRGLPCEMYPAMIADSDNSKKAKKDDDAGSRNDSNSIDKWKDVFSKIDADAIQSRGNCLYSGHFVLLQIVILFNVFY